MARSAARPRRARRPTRRTSWAGLAAALAGAVVVALVLAGGGGGAGSAPPDRVAAAPGAAPAARGRAPVARVAAAPAALDPAILSAAALREALARYEAASVYPPGSHLHTEETAGQHPPWNRPFPTELTLDDRPGGETIVRLAPDRHHVEFGEALTVTLEVVRAADPSVRLPARIRSVVVVAAGAGRTGVELALRDDGHDGDAAAGDRVYTGRLVPSRHDELAAARRVRLQADVEAGGVDRLVHLDFTYTPRPLLDLVALDARAADGSLAIGLDLDVHEPGAYAFAAEVAAGDEPVGWISAPWQPLAGGRQRVELALFGKVLRDRGLPGPYVIRGLRAERRADGDEVEAWWHDGREHVTAALPLEAFSPDPWDGPDRREIIATLERSIAEQEAAERAAGGR